MIDSLLKTIASDFQRMVSFVNFRKIYKQVNMKKIFLQVLPFLMFLLPLRLLAQELHVSKKGNDNNPGTQLKPLATPEGARNLLRKQRKKIKTRIIRQPFSFTAAHTT